MKIHEIAVIPGDGIGKEVVPESLKVLELLADIMAGLNLSSGKCPAVVIIIWNMDR